MRHGAEKPCPWRQRRGERLRICGATLIRRVGACGLLDRETDEESGPLTEFAFHANPTAMRINDIFYNLGSQPRPSYLSTYSLLREQAIANFRRHAGTGIADGYADHPVLPQHDAHGG